MQSRNLLLFFLRQLIWSARPTKAEDNFTLLGIRSLCVIAAPFRGKDVAGYFCPRVNALLSSRVIAPRLGQQAVLAQELPERAPVLFHRPRGARDVAVMRAQGRL
jgi:hypothetical protein